MTNQEMSWARRMFRSPRTKAGLCAGLVVLSFGGIVLKRASAGPPPSSTTSPRSGQVRFAGPRADGTFSFAADRVLVGEDNSVLMSLDLTAHKDQGERASIDLAVLLDTSGSMSGTKIADAKKAILTMLAGMRNDDRIMLWRYDSGARLVVPLIEVAAARTRIAAELAAIEADGGTDIASALSAGFEALQQQITSHGVRRIVLVSDGLDQKRDESQRIAMRAAELGIGVSALGVGLDFDEGYMAGVARSGQGNFGFAENGPQLAQFLAKENELAARTAIENAVAELELAPGLRFVRAFGIEGARVEGGRVRLPLGSIAAGGQRRVVIELRATTRAPGERLFVDGSLSWTARATHGDAAKVRLSRLELTASDDPSAVLASRDAAVWSRCHEVMAAAHQLDAAAAYSRGDRGRALQLSKSSRDLLGEAQDAAPPGARAEIDDKARRYQELDRVYGTAADADGRAAAKRAAEGAAQDLR